MSNLNEAPCPDWCQSHFGIHGQDEAVLAESRAHELEPETVGKHTNLFLKEKNRWFDNFPCQAVRVEQDEALSGRKLPVIEFWHGHPYVRNLEPHPEVARAPLTHYAITVAEARRLGEALLEAARLIERILPERCRCGEPVAELGDECEACWVFREKMGEWLNN